MTGSSISSTEDMDDSEVDEAEALGESYGEGAEELAVEAEVAVRLEMGRPMGRAEVVDMMVQGSQFLYARIVELC